MAYSDKQKKDIVNSICESIEKGVSLRNCLKEHNISSSTFYEWIDSDSEKAKQYARACELRAELIFEDILSIADAQEKDVVVVDGKETVNHDVINRARLRVDSRKWMLSKMMPKKYGDKVDVTTDGERINIPVIKWVDD